MRLQQPFDANQVEPTSFAPPPVLGEYHVRIIESEPKTTKDNSGGYLNVILEILDPGPYQGRKIPYNLNIFNANQQTVEIAYRQLSALCHVTHVFNVQDTQQLHGIPFIASIGPQSGNPQYSNVFYVKDINGNLPGKAGQPAAPQQPAPTTQPAWAPQAPQAPAAPAAPAWGAPQPQIPTTQPTAPWGAPAPQQPPAPPAQPAAPVWGAPQQQPPQQPAAPAQPQPAWAPPGGAQPAAPPWAR
jgi:hypothetical protein